jgi:hypothetical protein
MDAIYQLERNYLRHKKDIHLLFAMSPSPKDDPQLSHMDISIDDRTCLPKWMILGQKPNHVEVVA